MLLIVCHHYVVNSGLVQDGPLMADYLSAPSVFYWLIGMWGKTGINCFVMITGYFMCTSGITLRKFLKLILEIFFWDLVCHTAFVIAGYGDISLKAFLLHLVPVKAVGVGFTSCFILFWLTIPFLNILIKNMTQRQHLWLIVLALFTYTAMAYMPYGEVRMNYVSWFVVLYFISSYIRLYPQHIWHENSARTWALVTVAAAVMAMASVVAILVYNDMRGIDYPPFRFVSDSNSIFALAVGVASFMLFKNIHIPHSRFINAVGATTFGVLLIHANSDTMRQWLWKDVVDSVGHYNTPHYYIYAPLAVAIVFAVCSLLDWIRIKTVERWLFAIFDTKYDKWKEKHSNILLWIKR